MSNEEKQFECFVQQVLDSPLADNTKDWVVIGSAAAWMNGVEGLGFPDFDILTSADLALRTARHWDVNAKVGTSTPELRSEVYAVCNFGVLTIDLIAEFESFATGDWEAVAVDETSWFQADGIEFQFATIPALIKIYKTLGREKDKAKIELLRRF